VVPANVDSIKVTLSPAYGSFFVSTLLPPFGNGSQTISHKFKPAEKGSANYKISTFFYNVTIPFTVTVERFPKSFYLSPIVINNVTCQSNKITLLTGKLFTGSVVEGGFHISFDPAWNSQTTNL
jgi:hypothetical protein